MIRLFKTVVILGLLWSGFWYAAGYGLRSGIRTWFAAQQARGWQAEFSDISTSGYPLRHVSTLTSPALADPVNGTAWRADWLRLDSPAIWPGRQTLHFAPSPQRISYYDQTSVIEAQQMVAQMHLHPGLALALDRMTLTAGQWQVMDANGPVLGADSLTLAMVQTDQPDTYQFDIAAGGFTPGNGLRRLTRSTDRVPPSFETLKLDMKIRFDRVWDRGALEDRRPQPVQIDLALADIHWGALRLQAAGRLSVDAQGIPTGAIVVKAESWREMLAMAQAAGAIPPEAVSPTERVLNMLSSLGRTPDALDVQVNFRDGFVALGPLPLGPAPRLILR